MRTNEPGKRGRAVYSTSEMPQELREAIRRSEAPEHTKVFNDELPKPGDETPGIEEQSRIR